MTEIPSPYAGKTIISKELVELIKKETGTTSVFLAVSNEDPNHVCTPEDCQGHEITIGGDGMTINQVLGLSNLIANTCGFKVVPKEDDLLIT